MIELRWLEGYFGSAPVLQYRTRIVEAGMIGDWGEWQIVPTVAPPPSMFVNAPSFAR